MIKGVIIGISILGIIGVGTTIYLLKNKKHKSNKEINYNIQNIKHFKNNQNK